MKPLFPLACLSLALAACQPDAATPDCERTPEMPPGMKLDHYHSPTPACVPQGTTLDTAGVQSLQRTAKPILIDVWAILLRKEAGFPSEWLPNDVHDSLPGAVWLPNVGYGTLEPDTENYLQHHLQRLTDGDKTRPLVFFCVADCWMSWNASQRASAYGYTQVYWYKEGTDGWAEAGLPLIKAEPIPLEAAEAP